MSFETLADAMAESVRVKYAWLRYLMTLATGVLALLATLQGNFPPHTDSTAWLLRGLWAMLGLSILVGAYALSGEVWLARERQISEAAAVREALVTGTENGPKLVVQPTRFQTVERAFYVLLCGSLVLLVLFGILNVP